MTGPGWTIERRYGMHVHANIATVASFAPIGEHADWYWSHLGSDRLVGTGPHPTPMAEVLAYHRDRWSHVGHYDELIPFLSFHRFDADELGELAVASGMRHLVQTAKHQDGFCWWDVGEMQRSSVRSGPMRDVLAEVSSACRRFGLQFGTSFSPVDWSAPGAPIDTQVLDLVERYGSQILWADGPASASSHAELIDRARDLADAVGAELAVNDGWGATDPTFASMTHPPPDIVHAPWELHRPLGASAGLNRAERAEHLLSTGMLLDVLTEVVAKGGNLLIDVGLGVDGTIGELQQHPLRAVGTWVEHHPDIIHGGRPFDLWGDAQVRYVVVDDDVVAIDLAAGSSVVLAGLTLDRYDVSAVSADDGGALHWEQHRGGITISRIDRSPTGLAGVYRISLREAAQAIRLFEEAPVESIDLGPLLADGRPGDVVQLGDGHHHGLVRVPDGVTLRGVGWDRTVVDTASTRIQLLTGSRLEHVRVTGSAAPASVGCIGDGAAVVGCRIDGDIHIDAADVVALSTSAVRMTVTGERSTIERCTLKGDGQLDVGIHLAGGNGHRVVRNEVVDHICAIRASDTSTSVIAENRVEARWWGVHLLRCDHVEVADNQSQHTMRAVDVDGGNGSVVTGNWIADGDSGALVQFGATDTSVIDNHIERCRIGIIVWDAPSTRLGPNTFVDIHEEEPCVFGPDADTDLA